MLKLALTNPARSDSYYVVHRGAAGADHIVWGVDLKRAIAESGALPGQQVSLENLGRRWVTVNVPVLDAAGKVIGEEEREVYRNTWQVDVMGREYAESRRAAPAPESEAGRVAPVPQQEPVAGQCDSPLAAPQDREVQLAVLVAAMREQGFSERSIARVQQRAERMLDAFQAEGVSVPRPRVFDPEAPSTRGGRARAATGRTQTREVERVPSEPSSPAL